MSAGSAPTVEAEFCLQEFRHQKAQLYKWLSFRYG